MPFIWKIVMELCKFYEITKDSYLGSESMRPRFIAFLIVLTRKINKAILVL